MIELLMNTMPFLDTVAGDALSMLCTSKMILQFGAMEIRSPFAKVKVLLSSSTELRFSIQMASTGPSSTSHTCSPWWQENANLCHVCYRECMIFIGELIWSSLWFYIQDSNSQIFVSQNTYKYCCIKITYKIIKYCCQKLHKDNL